MESSDEDSEATGVTLMPGDSEDSEDATSEGSFEGGVEPTGTDADPIGLGPLLSERDFAKITRVVIE